MSRAKPIPETVTLHVPFRPAKRLAGWFSKDSCRPHSNGKGSSTRARVTSCPCFPSRIASTMSGPSSVRRRTRVM